MAKEVIHQASMQKKVRARQGEAQRFLRDVVLQFDKDECLIWPFATVKGYGTLRGPTGRNRLVSRIACEKFNGLPPSPMHHAAHSCGNGDKGCCSGKHLYWATPTENNADKLKHGTRGIKLTPEDVLIIKTLRGMPLRDVADRFGCNISNVSQIWLGRIWKHLE